MVRIALTKSGGIILVALIASASASALEVKTGLWEVTLSVSGAAQKVCMPREILDADFTDLKLPEGLDCTNEIKEKNSELLVTHTVCHGDVTIEADTRVEVLSPEAMSLQSNSVMSFGDQQRKVSSSAQYKWLSDDCGDVKPFELNRAED